MPHRFRAICFATVCCAVALFAGTTHAAHADARPNILVILVDDLGYGDLSCHGAEDLQTPHIDGLIRRGMRFENFYANCSVCSPTRAALLTGKYPDNVGVPGVIRTHPENSWGYLSPDAVMLPSLLQSTGYRTGLVGKWHLGLETPNTPNERGFDHFHGFLCDMVDDYNTHRRHGINYMRLGSETIDPPGHCTDLFSDWAVEFLQAQQPDRPFFLYLAYNAPHSPIQPPADWLDKVHVRDPNLPERRAKLVALIEHLDAGIGRVLAELDGSGQADNTLIVFTSDNGGQLNLGAANGPHRDGKGSMYEGGLKVPAGVAWPGRIAAESRTSQAALTMDLFPTLCEAADVTISHEIDGRSFLPTLRGEAQGELRDTSFFRRREGGPDFGGKTIEAVRRGDWKLLQNSPFGPQELYNLRDDPLEAHNVIEREPAAFKELSSALSRQIQVFGRTPWQK